MYARPARLGARLNALGLTVRRWRGRDGGQREGNAAPTADPRHATLLGTFRTAPARPERFVFTAFGDQGVGRHAVASNRLVLAQNPAFHLHTGDIPKDPAPSGGGILGPLDLDVAHFGLLIGDLVC